MGFAIVDDPAFRAALETPSRASAIRDVAEKLIRDCGGDRDAALEALEDARAHFRHIGRENVEDNVLDVMDVVSGWCGPQMRVAG
jgi:hypothetical protein